LAAVIECGSLSSAARMLGLSASGVSRAISRMEAKVGSRLLLRTSGSVALTEEGRRLYEEVWPAQSEIESAAAILKPFATPAGRLRVNVDPRFADYFAARHLALFLDSFPSIDLDLIARADVGNLVADGFDLGVRFGEPSSERSGYFKIGETRTLTVASPGYISRMGQPKHPTDLMYHECIQYGHFATVRSDEWTYRRGRNALSIRTAGRLRVTNARELQGACLAGVGIGRIMALGAEAMLKDGRLIELFPDWPDETLALFAIYPFKRQPQAKVSAFVDFCRREIR
jgi:DNA-binding transcriptional LysR family regulator